MTVSGLTGTRRAFALAFLGYTSLTLLLFHGLLGRFSTSVPHDLGDPLLSTWILWWNSHRLPFVGSWWDGLSFFPGPGSLAFSDHRVGLTLIAGPIQWVGGTPVLAYNVALLSSFVFSAMAAHTLAWVLTRNHGAGLVSGLVFGFSPFRMSHVAHLELLAVFWLPLAFAALHLYVRRYDWRWLLLFAVCWFLQGLSSGYYLFYSAPVIGLWALWFARDRRWRGIGAIALACGLVFAALLPILLRYRAIQDRLLLMRSFAEIEGFSADIAGILSATRDMALWRFPSLVSNGEAEIYLGVFAPLLILAAVLWRRRDIERAPAVLPAFRMTVAVVGAIYTLIAVGTLFGSWSLTLGPLKMSASQTVQPLSIAVFCLCLLGLTSGAFVDAFRRRSIFAFYITAAVTTWMFTLGPRPRLLGELLIYRGPYEFLMLFPGYDERLRVPARFVMMTILAVAIAAGIALLRVTATASQTRRRAITAFVVAAIIADSWTFALPMPAAPQLVALPDGVPASAAVLELPLGNVGPDIAAVYRSIGHRRPVVNGYSGYEPPHYRVLRTALAEHDDSVLTTLTKFASIAVIIARESDPSRSLQEFVERHDGRIRLPASGSEDLFLLPVRQPGVSDAPSERVLEHALQISSASFNLGAFDLAAVTDGNRETVWVTPKPQQGREEIVLELTESASVSGVSLSTGPPLEGYPRWLAVDTSLDGRNWEERWSGAMGGPTVEGILRDARSADARIAMPPKPGRFVRLRQLRVHPDFGWFIAELRVYGSVS